MIDTKEINEYIYMRKRKIGLTVIGHCFTISHQTVKNRLKELELYEHIRDMDSRKEVRHRTYNNDIPIEQIDYFVDGWNIANGGREKHHDRKTLNNSPLILAICDWNKVLHYEEFRLKREYIHFYRTLIDNALRDGKIKPNSKIVFDVYYTSWFKELEEKYNIIPVVYGKTYERPYNSQIERQFANLSKTLYEDMKFIKKLSKSEMFDYIKCMVEVYWFYNKNPLINFLMNRQQPQIEKIEVKPLIKR